VVMARPPGRGLLRREQRLDQAPLGVGQLHLGRCGWRCGSGGWHGRPTKRVSRGVATGSDRLVGPSPARPAESERSLFHGFPHRDH
jgi:hypothetical protein